MLYFASAVAASYVFWLVLSGHYTPTLMIIGAISAFAVVALASRMAVVDREGHPIYLLHRGLLMYWPWLTWQIIVSGLSVTRVILARRMPISPTLVNVRASQDSAVGIVTYANSITLTPGTVSLDVEPGRIRVHALHPDIAEAVPGSGMDARVPDPGARA